MTCDEVEALSAELALGVLDAQQRSAAVAHLEACAECLARLRSLREIADELVGLTPPMEPPAGFESRVLDRVRRADELSPRAIQTRTRRWWAAAAAAAALAAGVSGWAAAGGGSPGSSPVHSIATASAGFSTLVSNGRTVGEVMLAAGSEPWISVAVQGGPKGANVTCEVTGPSGRVATVGTFSVEGGYGYWASPLPEGFGVRTVRTVRLVLPDGRAMATAVMG